MTKQIKRAALHVFRVDDNGETFWYIARSAKHAQDLFFFDHASYVLLDKYYAKKIRKDALIAYTKAEWDGLLLIEQLADDKNFTMLSGDDMDEEKTQTAREWIWEWDNKPGLLASTCF